MKISEFIVGLWVTGAVFLVGWGVANHVLPTGQAAAVAMVIWAATAWGLVKAIRS